MSSYELNKVIHHVYIDCDLTMAFRDGDYSMFDAFDQTDDECEVLTGRDFPALWAKDIHPVLLIHFSAVLNSREWYVDEVVSKNQGVPNSWYDYYGRRECKG